MCFGQSVHSGLNAEFDEMRAVGGAPTGTAGYPESSGCREYGSLGDRAGAASRYEQVTSGGYSARPKEAGVTGYHGYKGAPQNIVRANQATVSGHVDGVVKLALSDVANSTGIMSRLFATVNTPMSTRPESLAAQLKSTVTHLSSGWTSNQLSCMQVSDTPTWILASPNYCIQHISDSRTTCDQPRLLSP